MSGKPRAANKFSMLAREEIIQRGINPIDMLMEVYTEAMNTYREGVIIEHGEKSVSISDPRTAALAVAGKVAADLMKYYSPQLSAIKVEVSNDDSSNTEKRTVLDAAKIINSDPFAQHAMKIAEKAGTENHPSVVPILSTGVQDEET